MSGSPETVAIEFKEVPIIRTRKDLAEAAGMFMVGPHVCIAELDDRLLNNYASSPDPALTAMYGALRNNSPELTWQTDKTKVLHGPKSADIGLHNDQLTAGVVTAVVKHSTGPRGGAVEATFARATQLYQPEHSDRLTRLLIKSEETDSRYAVPNSFQRAVLEQGGTFFFSPDLLHMFRTMRAYRFSDATVIGARR